MTEIDRKKRSQMTDLEKFKQDSIIWIPLILLMFLLAAPNFFEANIRAKVSRVRTDLRSIRRALEAYRADHRAYLPSTTSPESVARCGLYIHPAPGRLPTFLVIYKPDGPSVPEFQTYADYPSDPFAPQRGATFVYFMTKKEEAEGWILTSPGPDGDYDIDPAGMYDPSNKKPSATLVIRSYDPTNGSLSDGDIWRTSGFDMRWHAFP